MLTKKPVLDNCHYFAHNNFKHVLFFVLRKEQQIWPDYM